MKSTLNPNPMKNAKHTRRTRSTALAAAALLAVVIGNTPTARAADRTWLGGNSTSWTDGANWVGGIAAGNGTATDTAVFNSGNYTFQPMTPNNRSIAGITIGASSGAVTINIGNTTTSLTIGSGGVTMASGGGGLTLGTTSGDKTSLGANQTWTNNSTAALGRNALSTANDLGAVTLTLSGIGSGGFTSLGAQGITQGSNSTLAIVVDYSGAGTVAMTVGSNTFSGGLTIKQGTVLVDTSNGTGNGTVTLGVNGGTANATLTSANGNQIKSYASAIVLATGHTGNLTIAATGANNSFGSTFTGGVTGTNNLIVDTTSPSSTNSIQFTTNGLNFTGNLTKTGNRLLSLGAANTFGGIALVEAGTLRLDHVNALQNATLNTGTSGTQAVTFTVAGANTYNLGGLQGADALAIGNNTISVGSNNASTTFSGAISGTLGQLTKVGNGTLTLSGNNTYTGATTVSAGTLLLSSTGSLAAGSAVTVQTGAAIGGDGTISGNLTLASGAKFVFDLNDNPLTVAGTFALDSTFGVDDLVTSSLGAIDWSTVGVGTYTLIGTTGFTFTSGNIQNFGLANAATSGGKLLYFENGSLDLVVALVPEPSTFALLAVSLTTIMVFRRRSRS